ncbi:phosphohistidine phosphatase, SixA [Thalassotalea agarivorans]|uniref:Phosphohistidine phosphatase, SixA n=2 Tax=Thalassotalea agarivorans TaxID=349064 RepID=A0A1I0BNY6_THASX|nr:phosphohistidine phosphatase, SixA [Thalassotalea agarivorans]
MRHGQAEAESIDKPDAQRVLTEQGKLEAKVMGSWLAKHQPALDFVIASPYIRAQQTADIVLNQQQGVPSRETSSLITPSGNASNVHDYLDGLLAIEKWQSIALFSHMPIVSYLTAELTDGNNTPIFQTAAIAVIDYDMKKMKGQLLELIAPNDLC